MAQTAPDAAETSLLERIRTFEMAALAEVYDTFSPAIYRYAMRLLADETVAEDCVTETFSRLLTALKMGNGPSAFLKAYLFRCAHNWITDHFRSAGRTPVSLDALEDEAPIPDDAEPPLLLVAGKLDAALVRDALLKLTNDQRQVIVLRYYEGLSNEEIAAALEKPVGAVKALLHRGLASLRRALAQHIEVHP